MDDEIFDIRISASQQSLLILLLADMDDQEAADLAAMFCNAFPAGVLNDFTT